MHQVDIAAVRRRGAAREKYTDLGIKKLLREWYRDGRNIRHYQYSRSISFFKYIFDISDMPISEATVILMDRHYDQIAAICGPHGWAVLQMLIIQAERRDDERQQKAHA